MIRGSDEEVNRRKREVNDEEKGVKGVNEIGKSRKRCKNRGSWCESGDSDSTPPSLDNKLDTPVKVPITHSIQNKTWRDVEGHILHNNP